MMLQLADSMVRYPAGIAADIPVRIRGCFIPVDFMVLVMDTYFSIAYLIFSTWICIFAF